MLNFTFENPTAIYFGKGQIKMLSDLIGPLAKKVLIVTGMGSVKKNGIFEQVIQELDRVGVKYVELPGVQPNPRLQSVYEGIELARSKRVDLILAVGGGSVIDAAKAIAAGVFYPGDVWSFFAGKAHPEEALPVATVLTLSATGSEMNPNTVITNEATKEKVALSAEVLRPVFSILDPEYTFTVNSYQTAAGVADIMAHIFEYYLTPIENCQIQEHLQEALLKTCIHFGPIALKEPQNYAARANLMWASTLALNGLAGRGKTSDFTLHMIEHEVSAVTDLTHGVGLAILIPSVMKVLTDRYGPEKLASYGTRVWGLTEELAPEQRAKETINITRDFFNSLGMPSTLKEVWIKEDYVETLVEKAYRAKISFADQEFFSLEEVRKIVEISM